MKFSQVFGRLSWLCKRLVRRVLTGVTHCLAPIVNLMATTGIGTDRCLRLKCLPMPVHYFSPVPDLAELEERQIWERRSTLAGIDFRPDAQLAQLRLLGEHFGQECDWTPKADPSNPTRFHTENGSFSFGCAASTYTMIRQYKPQRVMEIGSGNSSKVIAEALARNTAENPTHPPEYLIIDPYPQPFIEHGLPGVTRFHKQYVERVDLELFTQLQADDILFIDSGHTVRIGSDVNFLYLDVLPRLAPGVIVHIHDIALPYEYPKKYATTPHFRMFWTEAYLLQDFLSGNRMYEVLLGMSYLYRDHFDAFRAAFPFFDPALHLADPVSFWMRRVQPDT